jgi:hypothetical protein
MYSNQIVRRAFQVHRRKLPTFSVVKAIDRIKISLGFCEAAPTDLEEDQRKHILHIELRDHYSADLKHKRTVLRLLGSR